LRTLERLFGAVPLEELLESSSICCAPGPLDRIAPLASALDPERLLARPGSRATIHLEGAYAFEVEGPAALEFLRAGDRLELAPVEIPAQLADALAVELGVERVTGALLAGGAERQVHPIETIVVQLAGVSLATARAPHASEGSTFELAAGTALYLPRGASFAARASTPRGANHALRLDAHAETRAEFFAKRLRGFFRTIPELGGHMALPSARPRDRDRSRARLEETISILLETASLLPAAYLMPESLLPRPEDRFRRNEAIRAKLAALEDGAPVLELADTTLRLEPGALDLAAGLLARTEWITFRELTALAGSAAEEMLVPLLIEMAAHGVLEWTSQ
jgi:hypothetical protein